MFLKQSSDNLFSRAVVSFEVAPHQDRICPHGMKVVTYGGFTEQEISDTCQNIRRGGGHGATLQVPGGA